ncbi:hypothetical protein A9K55_008738 [Cordyceps militaris]|uniref:Uncharacterized protein n=1 Tax=Cordyceps militaris TaxID=73501 RepID=A0A2H4SEL2_CORMI|nr:hypothetical protein A9K55_008738 [Cordyceps militaris]
MRIMDRHSKLAEIKLVSKYYPVANYSYPSPASPTNPTNNNLDRCSVGSDGSAPGLIDDRTDSEVSQEDDYQLHSHSTELWDSFWKAGGEWRLEDTQLKPRHLRKEEHPAPAPSRQHTRQTSQKSVEANGVSWPLRSSSTNTRKTSATYSAFPSLKPVPHPSSLVPAPLSPRSPVTNTVPGPCTPPPRPRRPEALLTPCLRQPGRSLAVLTATAPAMQLNTDVRPKTSSGTTHRPKKSTDGHTRSRSNVFGIHRVASRSSEDLTKAPATHDIHHGPRHYKSTTYLGAARQQQRQQQLQQQLKEQQQLQTQQQATEPHSVFEHDSDCEESGGISFFRFHKRSSSDKSYKASATAQNAAVLRKGRNRADTIPAPFPAKSPSAERERRVDVFGRMLGRRSR